MFEILVAVVAIVAWENKEFIIDISKKIYNDWKVNSPSEK